MENLNNQNDKPTLITAREALKRVQRSKSWLYTRLSKGEFPRPVRVGARSISFVESEVTEWIKNQMNEYRNNYEKTDAKISD
ncbi:AlpA family phage regulatory protein [Salmonella enterica]|nr:AlpA family phage regulatory protein [Salmonella enterica]EHQ9813774.1 AlpA family phage regulatory protein [Salmonella enterica]EIX6564024.1 AlpA family phage regulatory protein [Salmonella enterica]